MNGDGGNNSSGDESDFDLGTQTTQLSQSQTLTQESQDLSQSQQDGAESGSHPKNPSKGGEEGGSSQPKRAKEVRREQRFADRESCAAFFKKSTVSVLHSSIFSLVMLSTTACALND